MTTSTESGDEPRIVHAAALAGVPVAEFVRDTMEDRVQRVVAEHEMATHVPVKFHEDLLAALDLPARPPRALARAARRADVVVEPD